jgi:hypothetical protein
MKRPGNRRTPLSGLAFALLAGCATMPPLQVADTFCLTAKKRSWSINDTPAMIREAKTWNQLVDRRCATPPRTATPLLLGIGT